jgi:hypothetical protein
MNEDAAERRAKRARRAAYHVEAQRRQSEQESVKAQELVDRFVVEAGRTRLPTEELTARPWSGRGRYRTGVTGWYLRRDRSIGVGVDGSYYVLLVPPVRFGRWRTVPVDPTPPPLVVGRGGRDGDSVALEALLRTRLEWPESSAG